MTLSPADPTPSDDVALLLARETRSRAYRRHWHTNLLSIAILLAISATVSFVPPIWARQLAQWRVAGMELPFYMGAQGAIVIYVLLVAGYAIIMRVADQRLHAVLAGLPNDVEDGADGVDGVDNKVDDPYGSGLTR